MDVPVPCGLNHANSSFSDPSPRQRAISLAEDETFENGPPRSIYVGTPGDLKYDTIDETGAATTIVWTNAAGLLPLAGITRIYSTVNGTTCSGIIALF